MRPDRAAMFARLQEPELNTGCVLWAGFIRPDGYGQFWDGVTYRGAHRLAWALANGPAPRGVCVCHRCDTPACVNPAHLFLGSNRDNIADRVRKGRSRGGSLHGEANRSAKLKADDVREIRRCVSAGEALEPLARRFGVVRAQIQGIASGRRWTTVT